MKRALCFSMLMLCLINTTPSFAQFARTVSRANCASPTIPLLSPSTGVTFNESISWDPKFWAGHYVEVTSRHMWSRLVGFNWNRYWEDSVESVYRAGKFSQKTWRAWAGKVSPYRDVTVAGTPSGYRWVAGTHAEKLSGSNKVFVFYTDAVNCNLTRW